MSLQQFNFQFTRNDGSIINAKTDPIDIATDIGESQTYHAWTYVNESLVLDGDFGSSQIAFSIPEDLVGKVALFNKLFGESIVLKIDAANGAYFDQLDGMITDGIREAGLMAPKRTDGNVHFYIDFQLNHIWELHRTESDERYTVPSGVHTSALVDFGFVAFDTPEVTHYLPTDYLDHILRRLLPEVNQVPNMVALMPLTWKTLWRQEEGKSQDTSNCLLNTTAKISFLAAPY